MNKLYNCLNGLKQLCSIEQMNAFLWATLLYFDAFLEHKRAASNENVSMTGYVSICNLNAWWDLIHAAWLYMLSALGKDARVTLKKSQKKVEQAKVNFGEAYSVLVLGLGHRKSHHTHREGINHIHYISCTIIVLNTACDFYFARLKVSKTITDQHLYEVLI